MPSHCDRLPGHDHLSSQGRGCSASSGRSWEIREGEARLGPEDVLALNIHHQERAITDPGAGGRGGG